MSKCELINGCGYKTAVCVASEPDDGCYPYRYMKKLLQRNDAERKDNDERGSKTPVRH